jgi:hypothetical protein
MTDAMIFMTGVAVGALGTTLAVALLTACPGPKRRGAGELAPLKRWRALNDRTLDAYEMTFEDGRRFRGYGGSWWEYPSGEPCDRETERALAVVARRIAWGEEEDKRAR